MSSSPTTPSAALSVRKLSKAYPGVQALSDVSFSLQAGQVLGVVGENGAGKSTLMKSIAGAEEPSSGSIEIFGSPLLLGNPRASEDAGVAMIYQELTLVPEMTAERNVFLGQVPTRWGIIQRKEMRRRYLEASTWVGAQNEPESKAASLSTANQQLLEIMRVLVQDSRLIIMDEPTASLGPDEITRLHEIIRQLKADGRSVLYVSHDLDAVIDISDEVLVMREGKSIVQKPAEAWTTHSLVVAMLGREPKGDSDLRHDRVSAEAAIEIRGLRSPGVDLDRLDIRPGEIIGIAGLVGSGRTRLLRHISGADVPRYGAISASGKTLSWPRSPLQAWKIGIALAPEDRKRQGLVLHQPASWNIGLGAFGRARNGVRAVTKKSLKKWAKPFAEQVSFASERLDSPAGFFSGGNQQKLMLARLLSRNVKLMLLDEPTRGIDIGAKALVFESMKHYAESGGSVLWVSSELEEVLTHSDRVLVVHEGKVVREFARGVTMREVLEEAFGSAESTQGSDSTAAADSRRRSQSDEELV